MLIVVKVHMEAIEEGGSSRAGRRSDEDDYDVFFTPANNLSKMKSSSSAFIEVLDSIKINNTKEALQSNTKSVLKVSNHTELKFSRDNLRKIEEKLICAFVEFHRKLWYLKSYRCMRIFFILRLEIN